MTKHITYTAFMGLCCVLFVYLTYNAYTHHTLFYSAPHIYAEESIEGKVEKPLLFTGDIMLGRNVENLMREKGGMYPFAGLYTIFKDHIVIANLEGTIPKVHVQTPTFGFQFSFPTSTAPLLKSMGIEAVSLANNHALDFGESGYQETKKILDQNNIANFGHSGRLTNDYFQTKLGTTTVMVMGINATWGNISIQKMQEKVKSMKTIFPQAHLVVFMHWGDEYAHAQSAIQVEIAHALIDSGADSIIGSHPHVVEGIEVYKGKPIFYSLGNTIFDQYWNIDVQDGYLLEMNLRGSMIEYSLIPIVGNRSSPKVADGNDKERILTTIANHSDAALRDAIHLAKVVTAR